MMVETNREQGFFCQKKLEKERLVLRSFYVACSLKVTK